jgi:hypothetical protein
VAKKSKSVKSRGRSGDRRHRGSEVQGKKPDFSGFLDSLGVDDDVEDEVVHGVGKAPY